MEVISSLQMLVIEEAWTCQVDSKYLHFCKVIFPPSLDVTKCESFAKAWVVMLHQKYWCSLDNCF